MDTAGACGGKSWRKVQVGFQGLLTLLVAQLVKNLPAMWETWIRSLGWKDPLEEGMATHSSTLAWRIPIDRGAWRATVRGVTELDTTE